MDQPSLFYESLPDALRDVVRALGGAKQVGARMRPELPADQAGRWLADSLNDGRREHLTPEQTLWLLGAARAAGVHAAMGYVCEIAGYAAPIPAEPADEQAQLQRAYIEAVKHQDALVARIERLAGLASLPPSQLRRV